MPETIITITAKQKYWIFFDRIFFLEMPSNAFRSISSFFLAPTSRHAKAEKIEKLIKCRYEFSRYAGILNCDWRGECTWNKRYWLVAQIIQWEARQCEINIIHNWHISLLRFYPFYFSIYYFFDDEHRLCLHSWHQNHLIQSGCSSMLARDDAVLYTSAYNVLCWMRHAHTHDKV